MEQYNDVTNGKRGSHLCGEISTTKKDSHKRVLREVLRTEGICFPSQRDPPKVLMISPLIGGGI